MRLRHALAACLLALSKLASGALPQAQELPRAVREPVRLTAGTSNELMGVLTPDEKSLYFVSDAGGTLDISSQSPVQSGPQPISAGSGDAAWPQISPDGQHIAYISFERDSTGDVCVRGIADHSGEGEHCWPSPSTAELVVLWWDAASLAVLSRSGLHGDFQLLQQPLAEQPARLLLARNMVGLALSPDHRWLAYVPLDKTTREVGITFSQRTSVGIGLQRFEPSAAPGTAGPLAPHGPPLLYVPRLPGVTGSVTFSQAGDSLLFTQFLNDTNRDGEIDGDDNAVVFRVPFHAAAHEPIALSDEPEQLTSARWDCHYPAPTSRSLIVSCSHAGSLDVYALPLEGAVPRAWDDARLAGEIAVGRELWSKLLLWARRLALAADEPAKDATVREMMALHLELAEYESTIYYAEHRLTGAEARAWGKVMAELARHRRAELALIRGEAGAPYLEGERARATALRDGLAGATPAVATLGRLVISEIEDDIGEKAASLADFRALALESVRDPLLVPVAANRAERLYRLRADRQSLLDVYRIFAALPALGVAGRLEYAQRYLAELERGRSRDQRALALARARSGLDDASELALLLDVEQALLTLDDSTQEAVRAEIFALYTQNKDRDRRRALVLATLRAAAKAGNEYVEYQFITSWASSLPRSDPERKNAEALYNLIVLDRGYGESRQGKIEEARGYFYGATLATDSLEAHIGFIEARLAQAGPDAAHNLDQVYAKRFADQPDSPVYGFVQAYRIARELPREPDPERHEQAVSQVLELLLKVDQQLPKQPQVHQLWGFALHQRARRTGSSEAAADANRQYLLALDLAQDDERLSATLLYRLGLVQSALGNYGTALRYLHQRDELPHVRPLEELGLRLLTAKSARHMGDGALSREQMQAAADLLQAQPNLRRFDPLVVDRLGLALVVAGDPEAASAQYEKLDRLLARDPATSALNQLKAEVGLAASALASGEGKKALEPLARADQLLEQKDELEPEPKQVWNRSLVDDYHYSRLQYQALVAGLRARAEQAAGNEPAALGAQTRRVSLLGKRLDESAADEDRLELAQAYQQQAQLELRAKNAIAAARSLERGLELAREFDANTGSEVNDTGLLLLRAYAELHLYGAVPLSALRRDLPAELRRSYQVICKYRSPRWAQQRFLFKTYLAELALAPASLTQNQKDQSP